MGANAGTINMELAVTDRGSVTVKRFSKDAERGMTSLAKTVTNKVGAAFRSMGKITAGTFRGLGKAIFSLKSAVVGLALYGVKRLVDKWEELAAVQEKAEAGMKAAMTSMGRYDDITHRSIMARAAELQTLSTFGDEAIIEGTKFLMTYGGITDDLMPRVMGTMTDLAALMGGDFRSAANMMGKASMGMVGELRRVGITVDDATFKSEGFVGVLEAIEAQVSGQAKALRETDAGGLESFKNKMGDVWEKVGAFTLKIKAYVAEELSPYIDLANEKLQRWIDSGAMKEKAMEIGYAIKEWIVDKIELATDWYYRLAEQGVSAAEWIRDAWAAAYPYLDAAWKIIKLIAAAFKKVGDAAGQAAAKVAHMMEEFSIGNVAKGLKAAGALAYEYSPVGMIAEAGKALFDGENDAGYASGTSYVPRSGMYRLHKGEAVLNGQEASQMRGSRSVSFGDVNINMPAGAAANSAREHARAIRRELQILTARGA